MTLHVHKDLLDCIDDSAVVKDFVACNEVQKDIFGKGLNLPAPLDITHPFNGPFSGTTLVSRYQKGKPIWILLKQEILSGILS